MTYDITPDVPYDITPENFETLADFLYDSAYEWDALKEELQNGADPFESRLYYACKAAGDIEPFTGHVNRYASLEHIKKYRLVHPE